MLKYDLEYALVSNIFLVSTCFERYVLLVFGYVKVRNFRLLVQPFLAMSAPSRSDHKEKWVLSIYLYLMELSCRRSK